MTFPYGGVWHDGALYVASDPTVWRLEDTDGDGVADKREVVITGFQAAGHASCMKGGFYGPDGFIYFCGGNEGKGFDLRDRSGTRLKDHAAACVFRIRPDGTGLEYFANGAAGVYDLCFDPSGDLFGVVTILKISARRRLDALGLRRSVSNQSPQIELCEDDGQCAAAATRVAAVFAVGRSAVSKRRIWQRISRQYLHRALRNARCHAKYTPAREAPLGGQIARTTSCRARILTVDSPMR